MLENCGGVEPQLPLETLSGVRSSAGPTAADSGYGELFLRQKAAVQT